MSSELWTDIPQLVWKTHVMMNVLYIMLLFTTIVVMVYLRKEELKNNKKAAILEILFWAIVIPFVLVFAYGFISFFTIGVLDLVLEKYEYS